MWSENYNFKLLTKFIIVFTNFKLPLINNRRIIGYYQ